MSGTPSPEKEVPAIDPEVEKQLPAPLADAIRSGSVSKDILKHSQDADEAMKAFAGHQGQVIELDEATNKRLLRKIDWNLMPVSLCTKCHAAAYRMLIESLTDYVCCLWPQLP